MVNVDILNTSVCPVWDNVSFFSALKIIKFKKSEDTVDVDLKVTVQHLIKSWTLKSKVLI